MSAAIASCAARLMSAGAGKSGKPCERFTALWRIASRVISRITDSVKRSALEESFGLAAAARVGWTGFILLGSVKSAIDIRVTRHDLDILARLGERNRVHEFSGLAVGLPRRPKRHAVFPGIVRGQRRFRAAKLFDEIGDVRGAQMDVVVRVGEACARILDFFLTGEQASRRADQLHEPDG